MAAISGQLRPVNPPKGGRDALPVFGNAAARKTAQTAGKDLAERTSEWLFAHPKLQRLADYNPRLWNLSLQDWSARIATAVAFYVPQTLLAFMEDRHKIETLARNIIVWTMTLGVLIATKDKKFGLNSLFNPFMNPRETLPENTGFLKKFINNRRFDGEIFDYLKKHARVDLKNWSGLDANHFDNITLAWKKLKDKQNLSSTEKKVLEKIPRIMNRISAFKFTAVGLSVAILAVVVGKMAMDIVFKFFAPFDHDFDPSKYKITKKKKNGKNAVHKAEALPSRLVPTAPTRTPGPNPAALQGYLPPPPPMNFIPSNLMHPGLMPNGYPPAPFTPFAAGGWNAYPGNAPAFSSRRAWP